MTLDAQLKKAKAELQKAEAAYPQGKIDQPKLTNISRLRERCEKLIAQIKKESPAREHDKSLQLW